MSGRLYAGASGFSYPSWKGGFYPADAKPDTFLHHYAERVNTVELNNTFYRVPEEDQFDRWAAQVPEGFRFAVTMSRRLTSFGRVEGIPAFVQTAGVLGERLGPVRIKVPQARDDGFLLLLLDSLSSELRWVLDFRHESWSAPDVDERLADGVLQSAQDLGAVHGPLRASRSILSILPRGRGRMAG